MRKYNISNEDYRMVEIVIIENKPHKAGPQWKFAGAFYFATVVLAMIGNNSYIIKLIVYHRRFIYVLYIFFTGYGHSTPVTVWGKAFCMIYAMVGIPLGLVMFQSIGERLNKVASVVIRRAKKYMKCHKTEATEMNLMLATGMLSSIIITTGAAVFSRYEGWSYFDSFYYCFVTLTTIGFGDYVALQVRTNKNRKLFINYYYWGVPNSVSIEYLWSILYLNRIPHNTEYCRKMSGVFLIFHCNWNIVETFLSNIAQYFIATLQIQLSRIFLESNKYLILLEIL